MDMSQYLGSLKVSLVLLIVLSVARNERLNTQPGYLLILQQVVEKASIV